MSRKLAINALVISSTFRFSGWLTEYIYLPSLPLLVILFGTTRAALQLSLVAFLVGIFFSQLLGGKIASVAGSKRALLLKLFIAIGGTILILTTSSVTAFIWGRLIQGLGVGLGFALSYVMINEAFGAKGTKTAVAFSYLGMAAVWYPSLAMIVGSHVYELFGWRANFVLLLGLYVIQMGVLALFLPKDKQGLRTLRLSEYLREFGQYTRCLGCRPYNRYVFSKVLMCAANPAYYLTLYQITAPISSGSSGGPVFNEFGEVIGVANSIMVDAQNLNFSISVDELDHLFVLNKPLTLHELMEKIKSAAP